MGPFWLLVFSFLTKSPFFAFTSQKISQVGGKYLCRPFSNRGSIKILFSILSYFSFHQIIFLKVSSKSHNFNSWQKKLISLWLEEMAGFTNLEKRTESDLEWILIFLQSMFTQTIKTLIWHVTHHVLFSVSRPYAMPELWGGGVPTSGSGQFSPRLWVPIPYSLSPTRRSKPAFQWQGTNERIHRQCQQGTRRTKDIHGGHQFTVNGLQLPRLWHEGPSSFQNSPEKPLPSSVWIRYCAWA